MAKFKKFRLKMLGWVSEYEADVEMRKLEDKGKKYYSDTSDLHMKLCKKIHKFYLKNLHLKK